MGSEERGEMGTSSVPVSDNTSARRGAHLQKLSEFHIVQVLLAIVPKVQSDEFAVPVKRDVMVDNSLPKNLLDIFFKREKKDASATLHRIIRSTAMRLQRRIRESLRSQDRLLLLRGTANLFVPRNPCRNATDNKYNFSLKTVYCYI